MTSKEEAIIGAGLGTFYAYFLSREFFISLLVVTMFTTSSFVFSLLNTKIPEKEDRVITYFAANLFKGILLSFCISILILGLGFYFEFHPGITIALGCIMGSNPSILSKLFKSLGNTIVTALKGKVQ